MINIIKINSLDSLKNDITDNINEIIFSNAFYDNIDDLISSYIKKITFGFGYNQHVDKLPNNLLI